jgi:RecA-family ATPase
MTSCIDGFADDIANPDAGSLLKTLRENLYIVPRVGEDNLMTKERDREVQITPFVDRLIKTVTSINNLRLIVVDPVSRFRGGEENSAEDTTRFVEAVERIAKTKGCAILTVHHTNKGSSNGEQSQSASRGSSALTDGVRLQINMSIAPGSQDNGGQLVELRITKSNYAAVGAPILLRRDGQGRLLPVDADEAKQEMQQLLFGTLKDTLTSALAEGRRYSKSTFKNQYGGVRNRFHMGINALAELIDRAVGAGELQIEPGREKFLAVAKQS